ncbi:MAG: hypothetical protein AAF206_02345 [Bacteroidota bacterium]
MLLLGLFSCQTVGGQSPVQEEPSSRDNLMRNFRKLRKMLVVYPSGDPQLIGTYKTWLERVQGESEYISLLIRSDLEVSDEELREHPVFLIGSITNNQLLQRLGEDFPLQLKPASFDFADRSYQQASHTIVLSFLPSPFGLGLPMGLLSGNSEPAILSRLQQGNGSGWSNFPWSNWGYQVYDDNRKLVMGSFSEQWTVDKKVHWDWEKQSQEAFTSEHLRLHLHNTQLDPASSEAFLDSAEASWQTVENFLETDIDLPPVELHLYGDVEEKAMQFSEMNHAHIDWSKHAIHQVAASQYEGMQSEKLVQLLLRKELGQAAIPALEEGLAVYLSPQWLRYGAEYWSKKLVLAGYRIPLEALLNPNQYQQESNLVRRSFAAMLIDFVIKLEGKEALMRHYSDQAFWEKMREKKWNWDKWLASGTGDFEDIHHWEAPALSYQKGMTFAHEGYSIYNGYGSKGALVSLAKLTDINVEAIAIVPYSGTRSIHKPTPFRFSQRAGSENDASVMHAAAGARKLGMEVLLKPQIWFPGSWPGDVEMQNEADWKAFFRHYRKWITHYAMMAEVQRMENFCVGVEFVKATRSHPKEWRKLINDLRKLYSGRITYAANWGEEVEKLAFGDALDFIGANTYYPLSKDNNPSDEELLKGAREAMDRLEKVSRKFDKPVVLTEVGFRSLAGAWLEPHAESKGQSASDQDQARCYQALLQAASEREWVKGMYWWKWPSFMEYGHRNPHSFTPCGKAAENILAEYYQKTY